MKNMDRETIGFAIVGCGMISEFQSKALQAIPDARIVGYHDAIEDLAKKRASEYGAKAFQSLEELLEAPHVDAISICTPSGAHLEPALAAARARKHVIVEKPLEVTL